MGAQRRSVLVLVVLVSGCGSGVVEASSYSGSSTETEGTDEGPSSMTVDPSMTTSNSDSVGDSTSVTVTDASAEDPSITDPSVGESTAADPTGVETAGSDDATTTTATAEGGTSTTDGCVPTDETCDGTDEDCDGVIDEGSPLNSTCGTCSFLLAADGGSYFVFCTDLVTWDAARTACGAFGAGVDLAIIDNAVDQGAIQTFVQGDTWMGLNDLAEEGHWVWVDGTDSISGGMVVGYDGWGATQPEGLGERCGEFDPGQFGWADAGCRQAQPYLCRHPA